MTAERRNPELNVGAQVLIVDDDEELCELLSLRLSAHGYESRAVHTGVAALAALSEARPAAVILDLRLNGEDGLELLVELLEREPGLKVLVLTAHGSIETAVEAMRRGAEGFMTKPFRDRELLDGLARAVDSAANEGAPAIAPDPSLVAPRLFGRSPAMNQLRALIQRVAATDATILVTGESGTGKELVARSLHEMSGRSHAPFVPLNCGALPPELLTSELFGHARGAFTGAVRDREGLFAAAHGGTLFLDEIGEASHDVQVRLLRVLQEQRYTPVGATKERVADVRVVAATNRDLYADVLAKRFREDLYYRLHVVPLQLPPLRQRGDDIALLAQLFTERAAARHKRAVPRLTLHALELLRAHPLPGNVRQLSHVMEAAVLLGSGAAIDAAMLRGLLTPEDAPAQLQTGTAPPAAEEGDLAEAVASSATSKLEQLFQGGELPPFAEVRRELERAYLTAVLRRSRGNVTAAAKMAGRHRTDFYELLRRHNLTGNAFRQP